MSRREENKKLIIKAKSQYIKVYLKVLVGFYPLKLISFIF